LQRHSPSDSRFEQTKTIPNAEMIQRDERKAAYSVSGRILSYIVCDLSVLMRLETGKLGAWVERKYFFIDPLALIQIRN
jgi:hypothetical protein